YYDSIKGVYLSDCPLDIRQGFEGPVVLCLEISEDIFEEYEWIYDAALGQEHVPGDPIPGPKVTRDEDDEDGTVRLTEEKRPGQKFSGFGFQPGTYCYAVIPATVLNALPDKPEVYDYQYLAGATRKEVVDALRLNEQDGVSHKVQELREAIAYLDRI